jgi:lipopolysaccharide export system protein LptC
VIARTFIYVNPPFATIRPVSVTCEASRGLLSRARQGKLTPRFLLGAIVNSVQNPAMQANLEARFAVAARHSRMVRFLRIAVPGAVCLAMAGVIGISIFNPFRMLMPKLPLDMSNLIVSGTKITMESPHLSGYTPDQRPYELWAKTAVQDVSNPDLVELNKLRTKVLMQDGSTTFLDSLTGLFDNKQQTLELHKDIYLQTTTGYEAWLTQAFIDLVRNTVDSDEHVDVKLTNGTVSSDKLRITGGGELIIFEGNVVMHVDHFDNDSAQPAPAPPPEPVAKKRSSNKSANSK